MPRAFAFLFCITVFFSGLAATALADKRVALIIGNSTYKNVATLPNPTKDAAAIAEMFRKANFDVVESRQNLSINDMKRTLREFTDQVEGADIAVIYYAGHGIEVDGTNYLVPIDAALQTDRDVEDEAVSLDRIIRVLDPAKRLRLVILDACRDNPLTRTMKRTSSTRSVGRGLAKVEPTTSDTLIAFAAKAGSTAFDGDGANSPFTAALVKNIATPGLDLRIAFGRVRDEVLKTTANKQEPFVYGSLGGTTVALVPTQNPPGDQAAASGARRDTIRLDYEAAERIGTKEAWESFLAAHKTGYYADLARSQLAKLGAAASPKSSSVASAQPPTVARSAPAASLSGYDGTYSGQICYGEGPKLAARCFQAFAAIENGKISKQWVTKETGYTTEMVAEVDTTGNIKIQIRGHFPDGRPGATIDMAGKIENNKIDATGSFTNGRTAELHWAKN